MNITKELQDLDNLIVEHTKPPVTAILRNKLHPLREQMEAYIDAKEKESSQHAQLAKAHESLKAEHAGLKQQPSVKAPNFSPEAANVLEAIAKAESAISTDDLAAMFQIEPAKATYL